jgi:hypothetical protein
VQPEKLVDSRLFNRCRLVCARRSVHARSPFTESLAASCGRDDDVESRFYVTGLAARILRAFPREFFGDVCIPRWTRAKFSQAFYN